MNTARIAAIQAAAPPSEPGTPPVSENDRAALAVSVIGLALAKTSGKTTTKPADWAASAPRTVKARKAKIQLSANPTLATRATAASALATPAWKRKPTT